MKNICLFAFLLSPMLLFAQVKSNGYNNYKWGQARVNTIGLGKCSTQIVDAEFNNCDIISKDSLLFNNIKYQFANARFFKGQLCEFQFDVSHSELGKLIAELSKTYGNPSIIEKKHKALDEENNSTGYKWIVGDTEIFIINDGLKMPAICVINSISLKAKYPINTQSLEKLIFE